MKFGFFDTDEGYFCFVGQVKKCWDLLSRIPASNNLFIEYEEIDKDGKALRRIATSPLLKKKSVEYEITSYD